MVTSTTVRPWTATTTCDHRLHFTARLDKGMSTEREVSWSYRDDAPVFIFRKQ